MAKFMPDGLKPSNDLGIGDMAAIPSEQQVHALYCRNSDMNRVFDALWRNETVANELASQVTSPIINVQDGDLWRYWSHHSDVSSWWAATIRSMYTLSFI